MKISSTNKMLLTILYGISLIFLTLLIVKGSWSNLFDDVITYAFYIVSVIAILKALSDLIVNKEVKDLIFLALVSIPLGIFLIYLVLSIGQLNSVFGGYDAPSI